MPTHRNISGSGSTPPALPEPASAAADTSFDFDAVQTIRDPMEGDGNNGARVIVDPASGSIYCAWNHDVRLAADLHVAHLSGDGEIVWQTTSPRDPNYPLPIQLSLSGSDKLVV